MSEFNMTKIAEKIATIAGKKIIDSMVFHGTPIPNDPDEKSEDFSAHSDAEHYLTERGYTIGSMCRDEPIGFAKDVAYIARWRNIDESEYSGLDGVIICDRGLGFREGINTVFFFAGKKD